MGFGIVLAPPDASPIQRAMREQELGIGPPKPRTLHDPNEWMRRLGTLPLLHQPGEQWMYDTPADVLGVLIARAAGQPLETFLHERIFDPLGMKDTGFSVPADKRHRLASCYDADPDTGTLVLHDSAEESQWNSPPPFPSGAGGLVSTADDYLAFGTMMLHKGMHGRERILSRPSVEVMTTDQLTATQKAGAGIFLGENRGWGFGMSVITKRDDLSSVPGRFGWDGGYGTSWYADPVEEMVCILMTQVRGFPSGIYPDFWTSAYQAIDD
jgi:CubicO group peptidase (beta-lactamase class C family)